ncbi:PRELI-like family-domain-containing protein [Dissophora ornata]|nr:PRELI-like family-domain-containing protein [Dissophora ornata]
MKFFQATHTFDHSWAQVTAANWMKYPNEQCPHVIAVDVLDRHVDPETGVLRTERLLTCNQNAPALVLKFLGGSTLSYVRETSELDPKTMKLTMKTQNLSMCNVLTINETVTYTVHPQDGSSTLFIQEAQIAAGSALSRFSSYVEDFCLTRFRDNAAVGRAGFETVLEKFKAARLEATAQLEKLEKATVSATASAANASL